METCDRGLPWAERFRPRTLAELKGQSDAVDLLGRYAGARDRAHLLFVGPVGCGKTSAAKVVAGQDTLLALGPADERGIDAVRGRLRAFCLRRCAQPKAVLLDAVDSMTPGSQLGLRDLLDGGSVRFLLTAASAETLPGWLVSRCVVVRLRPLTQEAMEAVVRAAGLPSRASELAERQPSGDARAVLCAAQLAACCQLPEEEDAQGKPQIEFLGTDAARAAAWAALYSAHGVGRPEDSIT